MDFPQLVDGFRKLSASDFDLNDINSDGLNRLCELTDAVMKLPSSESVIPEMFHLMERLPDVELGSPGPLVPTLEAIPGYDSYLADSIQKQPSLLSVWMVNRILNSIIPEDRRQFWVTLLQDSANRTDVSEKVRSDALSFLKRQQAKLQK